MKRVLEIKESEDKSFDELFEENVCEIIPHNIYSSCALMKYEFLCRKMSSWLHLPFVTRKVKDEQRKIG